jgi:HD-GYP domain-containing protein (c-di-GMP phosphodiesterase class II)
MNKTEEYIRKHLVNDELPRANKQEVAGVSYQKAQQAIDDLFEKFPSVDTAEVSKAVSDLASVILDDSTTIESLFQIMSHDYYTHTHSINVSVYAMYFGKAKGFAPQELEDIGLAGMLHDLGKVNIDKDIINKNEKLSHEEYEKIKNHAHEGYEVAQTIGVKDEQILAAIKFHHEKLDGSGYPLGLKGVAVPYFARIISICDIFDALTTKRSYKEAMKTFDALKIMKNNMADEIDTKLLADFIKIFLK